MAEVIGVLVVKEDKVVRHTHESPCNWYDVLIPAGLYEIHKHYGYTYYSICYPQVEIVADRYVNRLFQHSSVHTDEDVGKRTDVFDHIYNFTFDQYVKEGKIIPVVQVEDVLEEGRR